VVAGQWADLLDEVLDGGPAGTVGA